MDNKLDFLLLGTEGCHLCELASPIVIEVAQYFQVNVYGEDIAECDNATEMIGLYGEKIPVLLHEFSNQSLCWPFDHQAVDAFIREVITESTS